jgi:hypothetical protein
MQPLLRKVVTEPQIYLGNGNIFRHENAFLAGERLLLPLATNGTNADGLLGATEYKQDETFQINVHL